MIPDGGSFLLTGAKRRRVPLMLTEASVPPSLAPRLMRLGLLPSLLACDGDRVEASECNNVEALLVWSGIKNVMCHVPAFPFRHPPRLITDPGRVAPKVAMRASRTLSSVSSRVPALSASITLGGAMAQNSSRFAHLGSQCCAIKFTNTAMRLTCLKCIYHLYHRPNNTAVPSLPPENT